MDKIIQVSIISYLYINNWRYVCSALLYIKYVLFKNYSVFLNFLTWGSIQYFKARSLTLKVIETNNIYVL
jgi:hypothetical protein